MTKPIVIATALLFIAGCKSSVKENINKQATKDTAIIAVTDTEAINKTASNSSKSWSDSLIDQYIQQTKNGLVRLAIKDKKKEEGLFDQTIGKNDTKYFVFQVGHDEFDEGNTNKRFITDAWLYIDSLTRKMYEYDLPNDSLIEWKK